MDDPEVSEDLDEADDAEADDIAGDDNEADEDDAPSLDGAPGCHAIGNVVGCEPGDVSIGDRVRAVFEDATAPGGEALRIPQWELARS